MMEEILVKMKIRNALKRKNPGLQNYQLVLAQRKIIVLIVTNNLKTKEVLAATSAKHIQTYIDRKFTAKRNSQFMKQQRKLMKTQLYHKRINLYV